MNQTLHDYAQAITLAARAHEDQFRRGSGAPYITHPLRVAERLRGLDFPEHVVVAGVLHDVVEDTDFTIGQVEDGFGRNVATLVSAMTKSPGETRKEYLDRFRDPSMPAEAVALKAVDRIDNLREGGLDADFTVAYAKESLRLLDNLRDYVAANAIRDGPLPILIAELQEEIW